jgi:exodeoxyribonuclease VII large subunit
LFENGCVHVYAVREITSYLRELLDANPVLASVWIEGECSNVSRPASGHAYFTLKDASSQLRAVFFAQRTNPRARTGHLVQNGAAIVAHGRIALYEQRGELQLYVDFVQPEGVGALQMEYERLRAQLEAEGLFDAGRKRALPRFPRRIGVVTSESGAVFHDICHVLERRWPLAEVVLAPTPVQGPEAVAGVIGGLQQLNARGDIDVIIAGRGGGSLEELWAFNDEHVARAIFGSGVPVVSAVGHETDYTIADFVADVRAPTPSAAAEIASPDRVEVAVRLGIAAGTMDSIISERLRGSERDVSNAVQAIARATPDLARLRQRIDETTLRGQHSIQTERERAVHRVGNCVWRLKSLDPTATLDRGYAIVQKGRTVVSSVAAATPGDALNVRVQDGTFAVQVGTGGVVRRPPKRRVPDAQAPLFTMPEGRV